MDVQAHILSWPRVEARFGDIVENIKAWCLGSGIRPQAIAYAEMGTELRPMLESSHLVTLLHQHGMTTVKSLRIIVPKLATRSIGWEYDVLIGNGRSCRSSGFIDTPAHLTTGFYAKSFVPPMVMGMIRILTGSAPEIPLWRIPVENTDDPIVLLETRAMHDLPSCTETNSAGTVLAPPAIVTPQRQIPDSPQAMSRELDRLCLMVGVMPIPDQGGVPNLAAVTARRRLVVNVIMRSYGITEGFSPDARIAKRRALDALSRIIQERLRFTGDPSNDHDVSLYLQNALGMMTITKYQEAVS